MHGMLCPRWKCPTSIRYEWIIRRYEHARRQQALDRPRTRRCQARGAQAGDADGVRQQLRPRAGCQRCGPGADRRLAGHGGAGARFHAAGDGGRHRLPHARRRPRPQPGAAGVRPAVPVRRHARAGARRRHRVAAGRRGDGQAGRRRPQAGGHPLPRRARHSGVRAPGPDPAVGAEVRRLPRAGPRRGRRRASARRGPRRCGGGRAAAGAGMRAVVAGGRHHRRPRHSHHRHRCRSRLRRAGAGAARFPRPGYGSPTPEVRQGLPRRGRFRGRRAARNHTPQGPR